MNNVNIYHYPPELLELLIKTIPKLCRAKISVLEFFIGAGVNRNLTKDLTHRVEFDRENINKYEISRTVIARINDLGDEGLRARREILKRVIEFEDFTLCWENDQAEARGLVAQIRELVGKKDTFTRMKQERDNEVRQRRQREKLEQQQQIQARKSKISQIMSTFDSLITEKNSQKRGKLLENVLNDIFSLHGIAIREAFTVIGGDGEGVVEQIDGAIEVNGEVYIVEMKWWSKPIGKAEISPHIVNVFSRGAGRGLFISASGYTKPAITTVKEALQHKVLIMCELREIITFVEQDRDLSELIREKVRAAQLDKNPFYSVV